MHRTATQVDERYAITKEEYAELLKQYFPKGPEGPLAAFPRKEKRKIAVLRRYLIEYGYLDREDNGRAYWVKGFGGVSSELGQQEAGES